MIGGIKLIKLNVHKQIGLVVSPGIHDIENIEFARQLVEKNLATIIEGEIPERQVRASAINKKMKK
jgi:ribosomal protein S3